MSGVDIKIKTKDEIDIMRQSGKIAGAILRELKSRVTPGVTTAEINTWAEELIKKNSVETAFKGYHGFPGVVCTSVNEEVVHAPPRKSKVLKKGDVLTLDFGVIVKGFYSDTAISFGVGKISKEAEDLIRITKNAMDQGIAQARVRNRLGDIGHAVQSYVEPYGYGIVRNLSGHGIGRNLHEDPFVLNYGKRGTGIELKEGMVFAIEPMLTLGSYELELSRDKNTFITSDWKLSAHFEHTVAITKRGPEVLTK